MDDIVGQKCLTETFQYAQLSKSSWKSKVIGNVDSGLPCGIPVDEIEGKQRQRPGHEIQIRADFFFIKKTKLF